MAQTTSVLWSVDQGLGEEEQSQARQNIGAASEKLTEVVNNHTTEIGQITESVEGIESSLLNKKDKQLTKDFNGSSTKTVTNISQDENGELNVEFEDIDLPQSVPNVMITSEDNSVNITSSEDAGTNTKTFDLSVKGGSGNTIAHDGTITGDGTDESPLSIQSALDVSNANIAPKYDPTATYPNIGTLCTYGNVLYRSKVAINTAEDWTAAHWDVVNIADSLLEMSAGYDVTAEFIPKYSNEVIRFGTIRYVPFFKMLLFNLVIEKRVNGESVPIVDIPPYHTVDHYDVFKYDTDKYRLSEYLGSASIYLGGNSQVQSSRPGPGSTFIWTDSSTINTQFVNYTEFTLSVYQYCIFGNYLLI